MSSIQNVPGTQTNNLVLQIKKGVAPISIAYVRKTKLAKIILSTPLTQTFGETIFRPLVNNKKLVFPTYTNHDSGIGLIFKDCVSARLTNCKGFVKITAENSKNEKLVYFVDPKQDVKNAYDAYAYLPIEISEEEALKKVKDLKEDFPKFKKIITVYNRHGVAVFGDDNIDPTKNALCWASPREEKVQKIECSDAQVYRDGGTLYALSKNEQVALRHAAGEAYYLNGEPATVLIH